MKRTLNWALTAAGCYSLAMYALTMESLYSTVAWLLLVPSTALAVHLKAKGLTGKNRKT